MRVAICVVLCVFVGCCDAVRVRVWVCVLEIPFDWVCDLVGGVGFWEGVEVLDSETELNWLDDGDCVCDLVPVDDAVPDLVVACVEDCDGDAPRLSVCVRVCELVSVGDGLCVGVVTCDIVWEREYDWVWEGVLF